jgi:hypothetical protein
VRASLTAPDIYDSPESLSYCNSTVGSTAISCFYGDEYNVLFPVAEANAMFVSTKFTRTQYAAKSGCEDAPVPDCAVRSNITSSKTFYFADIENFTVRLTMYHLLRNFRLHLNIT